MNAAPHATYPATGQYRAVQDRPDHYVYPWIIVAPDGTKHPGFYGPDTIWAEVARLNASDRATRAEVEG